MERRTSAKTTPAVRLPKSKLQTISVTRSQADAYALKPFMRSSGRTADNNDPLSLLPNLQSLRINAEREREQERRENTITTAPVRAPAITRTHWSSTLNTFNEQSLTMKELRTVARATVRALAKNGLGNCCLVGSMACYFYGMKNRLPHDIDMLISPTTPTTLTLGAEQIKRLMVSTDPNFYLVPSKNPRATYQVLWYLIPDSQGAKKCKVDVLLPRSATDMKLPFIPSDKVLWKVPPEYERKVTDVQLTTYPVIPLIPLLLLKLQAWHDHRLAFRQYMRDKVPQDVVDINEMLEIAVSRYRVHMREEEWIIRTERAFLERTEGYVREFVRDRAWLGDSREGWKGLGFRV